MNVRAIYNMELHAVKTWSANTLKDHIIKMTMGYIAFNPIKLNAICDILKEKITKFEYITFDDYLYTLAKEIKNDNSVKPII